MPHVHESWESIANRTGINAWKRGRGVCPFCESRTGFSCNDEKGVFHCFACNQHGDKISFIEQFHDCSFPDALRFFGLELGKLPAPVPAIDRRRRIREGLRNWAHATQRQYRDEYYLRSRCEVLGKRRLHVDPDDSQGWELLALAYKGTPLDELEGWLDLLIGTEEQQLTAYINMREIA